MRKMSHDILNACTNHGVHVACTIFDGAFQNLATRGTNGEPLTLIQLSIDLWKDVTKTSRLEIISLLSTVSIEFDVTKQNSQLNVHSNFLKWVIEYLHAESRRGPTDLPDKTSSQTAILNDNENK